MIDFYNYLPEYYNNESRDFQIFTRVFDIIENSLKFDIDTITSLLDTDTINNIYLNSIAEKVGFFNSNNYPDDILRFVISAFPFILKYKGSLKGVTRATQTFLKINGVKDPPLVEVDNKKYEIKIGIQSSLFDIKLLKALLEYIVPTGYFIDVYFYTGTEAPIDKYIFDSKNDLYSGVTEDLIVVRTTSIDASNDDNILDGRNDSFNMVGLTYVDNNVSGGQESDT